MSTLKITEKLLNDAKMMAEEILATAKAQEQRIIAAGDEAANAVRDDIMSKAKALCEQQKSNVVSTLSIDTRNISLAARRHSVENMFKAVIEHLASLPADKYFHFLAHFIVQGALPVQGQIAFNANDRARIPEQYIEQLNSKLPQGGLLQLSKTNVNIKKGCVINYGDIEVNLTIESICEQKREDIEDAIACTVNKLIKTIQM